MPNETPEDDYDSTHGKPGADFTPPPASAEWTIQSGNPVQDDAVPFKNLKGGGSSAG